MYEAHDALICIGEKNFIDDPKRVKFSNQHYIKSTDELKKLYNELDILLDEKENKLHKLRKILTRTFHK